MTSYFKAIVSFVRAIIMLCFVTSSALAQIKAKVSPATKTSMTTAKVSASGKIEDLSVRLFKLFRNQKAEANLWQPEFETVGTPAHTDLMIFLTGVMDSHASLESLAEAMVRNVETYSLKIHLLRYLEASNASFLSNYRISPTRLSDLKRHILQKYTEMIFSFIRMSGLPEYEPILVELRRRLDSQNLFLMDLKPEQRHLWQEELSQNRVHQYENLNLEEKKEDQYVINGIYIESKKTLAVDLSRSVYDNLITLAHEIVHAADPDLNVQRENLERHYAQIIAKLAPLIPTSNPEIFIRSLIQDTFQEMNRLDIVDRLSQLRDTRVTKLEIQLKKGGLEPFLKDSDFQGFMRSLISVTVENEYKAYTMSLALYRVLTDRYPILPPSLTRENFIQKNFKHPHSLQFTLSIAMDPFASHTHMSSLGRTTTPELTLMINEMKSLFEIHYLEQSKVMIGETSEKFKNLFAIIQTKTPDGDKDQKTPIWTRPGKFDSISNPYQLLAAKTLSAAWVVRFKAHTAAFISKMFAIHESLLGLRANFIDLHDTNFGELKLLGIQPEDNSEQSLPPALQGKCKQDLNAQPEEFLSYFRESRWSPQVDIVREDGSAPLRSVVSQQSVMTNLVRLNLLKAVRWLRLDMPHTQENFISIKAFQARLQEGQYDKGEISPAQAQELLKELDGYAKAAEVTADELNNIDYLMTAVSQMYAMAIEYRWQPVAEEFYHRLHSTKRFFENMGFPSRTKDIRSQMQLDINRFHQQVRERFSSCETSDRMEFYITPTLFQLGHFSIPLTALCYNRQLYIFRQTCDYVGEASTMIPDGRPETRIFMGGRPIRLEPF